MSNLIQLLYSSDQAIDDWVFKTPGLRALLLTEYDWRILREIADVLEVCLLFVYSSLLLICCHSHSRKSLYKCCKVRCRQFHSSYPCITKWNNISWWLRLPRLCRTRFNMPLKRALPNSGNTPFLQNFIIHILSGPVRWFTAKLIIISLTVLHISLASMSA